MIPNRLLLRAATVLALTRGGDGPFPTMAGEAVFDSKLMPVADISAETHLPVILVYTDADKRRNKDTNAARTWERKLELVIEIAISSIKPGAQAEWAETDAELEATLDLFEAEVETALFDPTSPWSAHWRKLIKSFESWESVPHRSAEQAARYAVRQIVIDVCVHTDCLPTPSTEAPQLPVTTDENGVHIPGALLPIPYLLPFERETLATSPALESTRLLLSGASTQPIVPALKRISLKVDAIDPADPNRLADGQTRGPDGRIEYEASIEGLDQ